MKTREQIIEDYFRARGADWILHRELHPEASSDEIVCVLPDGTVVDNVADDIPIDLDFDLFREHVIEVMREKGARPNIVTRSDGKEVFQWTNIVPIRLGVVIEDDCWTLAAIEAATFILEGEQDAE